MSLPSSPSQVESKATSLPSLRATSASRWQGAAPITSTACSFSFVGTQMSPGFDSSDFEIGYRDELVRRYPAFTKSIGRLTRAEFITSAGGPPSPTDASGTLSLVFTPEHIPSEPASTRVRLQQLV